MRFATMFVLIIMVAQVLLDREVQANDEVYRWVDKDGVVHFGDRPQGHEDAEKVTLQADTNNGIGTSPAPGSIENDMANNPGETQPSLAQQRRDERAANRAQKAEQKQAIAVSCEAARQRVAQLEPSPQVLVELEDGTVSRLDDNKRLELLAEAKTFISKNCTN